MNKLVMTLCALALTMGAVAQNLTPYEKYKIREGVFVEILDIHRVEKYGWDNLEVDYNVKNNTSYDIQKLDFMIHLLDKNKNEIGSFKVHATEVPKFSEGKRVYFEVGSEYVNENIDQHIVETVAIDIIAEEDESKVVSIEGSESVVVK